VSGSAWQTNDTLRGWIEADVTNNGYTKDMEVKLFYRRGNSGKPGATVTAWSAFPGSEGNFLRNTQDGGAVSQITDENGTFKTLEVAVPTPVYGETYEFRAVAYLNGVAIPNLNNSDYTDASIAVVEAIDDSPLSTAYIDSGLSVSGTTFAASQNITGIRGDYLENAKIDVRIRRNIVRDDKKTYFEQEKATLTRATAPGTYQIAPLTLSLTANDGPTGSADTYTVQWKYEWEQWETVTPGVIQSNLTY
jgi:hypothetical protein